MTVSSVVLPSAPAAPATRSTVAIVLVLAAMGGFAVMDGITKIVSATIPVTEILFVRYVVFCALVLAVSRARGMSLNKLAHSRQPLLQLGRALLLVVESGVFMLAFRLMPIGDVHAIAAVAPLLVVALSVPILGERVGWRRWAAVALGFAGVLLIVRPGFVHVQVPVLIALGGAVLWALYQVLVGLCARTDRSETTSLWTAGAGLAATTLVAPFVWVWPTATGWALLGVIAMLGGASHMALIGALGLTHPSLLQPFSYTLFIWAVVVGFVLFGDQPSIWTWAGAAVIVASGLYAWHRERRAASKGDVAPVAASNIVSPAR